MIIWDTITVLVGILLVSIVIDRLLTDNFYTESFWGNEPGSLVIGFLWMTAGNLIMASTGTATASQSVIITPEGIRVNSLFSKKFLAWPDIEYILLGELYTGRKVSGVFAPRKIAKIIKILGKDTTLRILEPPMPETKKQIITLLKAFAPERLQSNIASTVKAWLSIW
jgi:hypothetical protein